MHSIHTRTTLAGAIAITALALGSPIASAATKAKACSATCQRQVLDQYLKALVARQPAQVPKAASVRFTENGKEMRLGSGLWEKASALGSYRQYFTDPISQQAMFIGTVIEDSNPALLALRLEIVGAKIVEIEHIVARKGSHALFAPEAFVKPHASLADEIDKSARLPRERLIAIANSYFDGIEKHSSQSILAADTCQRVENGVQTTGRTDRPGSRNCQQSADVLTYIKSVDNRRFPIVDREHGIVVSTILFNIPGEAAPELAAASGDPAANPDDNRRKDPLGDPQTAARLREPRTLLLTEWFKIDAGKIQHIEAIMHNLPHGSTSGWPANN